MSGYSRMNLKDKNKLVESKVKAYIITYHLHLVLH
eukprot:SAG31_NODE_1930_length_6881_cov_6.976998_3_plen_35_part_00